MEQPMRLLVVEPLGTGGMIHYAYQLCTEAARQGANVTLVTASNYELDGLPHNFTVEKRMRLWPMFDPTSGQPPRSTLARARRNLRWTARRLLRGTRLISEWIRLTRYLSRQHVDLIQFGKINFPFEALFLAHLRRRGFTLTQVCHEFELRERDSGLFTTLGNYLYAWVYDNFSVIFFHAESNRRRFSSIFEVPAERMYVIPHGNENIFPASTAGVDKDEAKERLRQTYGLDRQDPVVLFFGTLTPSKGLLDLLEAFALVYRQNKRARLLVAGFPTKHIDVKELEGKASDLGISEATIFDLRYIPMEEVEPLMELARVAVYPYRNSTQSGALQVAYAFEKPVIATAVGGLPEAVEDGRSGFLVPPGSPRELATAMSKLIDDPKLAAEMGACAKQLSETRYSWKPIATRILDVYRELVSSRPPKEPGHTHDLGGKAR
jgi:glycosyltransferase involved in cell wall biosynthesis